MEVPNDLDRTSAYPKSKARPAKIAATPPRTSKSSVMAITMEGTTTILLTFSSSVSCKAAPFRWYSVHLPSRPQNRQFAGDGPLALPH